MIRRPARFWIHADRPQDQSRGGAAKYEWPALDGAHAASILVQQSRQVALSCNSGRLDHVSSTVPGFPVEIVPVSPKGHTDACFHRPLCLRLRPQCCRATPAPPSGTAGLTAAPRPVRRPRRRPSWRRSFHLRARADDLRLRWCEEDAEALLATTLVSDQSAGWDLKTAPAVVNGVCSSTGTDQPFFFDSRTARQLSDDGNAWRQRRFTITVRARHAA